MRLPDKAAQEFKEIWKNKFGKELTDAEAREYSTQIMGFAELLIEIAQTEARRKKRLEKEPEGFHLEENEGIYNCRICHKAVSGKNAWWDLNGVKCLDCQKNTHE